MQPCCKWLGGQNSNNSVPKHRENTHTDLDKVRSLNRYIRSRSGVVCLSSKTKDWIIWRPESSVPWEPNTKKISNNSHSIWWPSPVGRTVGLCGILSSQILPLWSLSKCVVYFYIYVCSGRDCYKSENLFYGHSESHRHLFGAPQSSGLRVSGLWGFAFSDSVLGPLMMSWWAQMWRFPCHGTDLLL